MIREHQQTARFWLLVTRASSLLAAMSGDRQRPEPSFYDPCATNNDMILTHGCPTNTKEELLIRRGHFLISYDHTKRAPHWVMEYLDPARLERLEKSLRGECRVDQSLDPRFRVTDRDYADAYRNYGLQRGHMAPVANYRIYDPLMRATNVYTNIAPQIGRGFNTNFEDNDSHPSNWGVWTRVEVYVRERAERSKETWVCTGPLFIPDVGADGRSIVSYQVIGEQKVAVPTHFFKAFILLTHDGVYEMGAFVVRNERPNSVPKWIFQYRVPLPIIEDLLGYELFPNKPTNVQEVRCKLEGMEKDIHAHITARQTLLTPPDSQRKHSDGNKADHRADPAKRNLFP